MAKTKTKKTKVSVSTISEELQAMQRQRVWHLKSRIMVSNRLQATVAGTLGYHSGMKEGERQKVFGEARKLIDKIASGDIASDIHSLVMTTMPAIEGFDGMVTSFEKSMEKLAKQLSVAAWVDHKDQRGFGIHSLAVLVGETGDLANYANPAKVWRRMGCAPYTFDDKTAMGATWRRGKEGKLPASEWEEFGYSPRRRSIAYLFGEGLIKQNGEGPYRTRYNVKKAEFAELNPDYKPLRCHLHGMLLATKLLLKNLWIEWNE